MENRNLFYLMNKILFFNSKYYKLESNKGDLSYFHFFYLSFFLFYKRMVILYLMTQLENIFHFHYSKVTN